MAMLAVLLSTNALYACSPQKETLRVPLKEEYTDIKNVLDEKTKGTRKERADKLWKDIEPDLKFLVSECYSKDKADDLLQTIHAQFNILGEEKPLSTFEEEAEMVLDVLEEASEEAHNIDREALIKETERSIKEFSGLLLSKKENQGIKEILENLDVPEEGFDKEISKILKSLDVSEEDFDEEHAVENYKLYREMLMKKRTERIIKALLTLGTGTMEEALERPEIFGKIFAKKIEGLSNLEQVKKSGVAGIKEGIRNTIVLSKRYRSLRKKLDKERIATFIALKTTDHEGTIYDVRILYNFPIGMLDIFGDDYGVPSAVSLSKEMNSTYKNTDGEYVQSGEISNHREFTMSAQQYSYEDVPDIPLEVIRVWQEEMSRFAKRFRGFKDRFDEKLYEVLLEKAVANADKEAGEKDRKNIKLVKKMLTQIAEAQENRTEGAFLNVPKEPFDLNEVIEKFVSERVEKENEKDARKERPLNLEFKFDEKLPLVMLNRLSIQGAIANIVQNATESELDIRNLVISTRFSEGEAIIEILDDGPGFPEEFLVQKKGKPYQEAFELGKTKRERGTGLGLGETMWYIMEEHGGSIRVDDRSDGKKGSKITITLPIRNQLSIKDALSEVHPNTDI